MVVHVVIFTWKPDVSEEQVERLRDALDALAGEQPDLVSLRHGPDLRFRDGNGDYALVATFRDRVGWSAYQDDPRHKAMVQDFVTPIAASRLAIQF